MSIRKYLSGTALAALVIAGGACERRGAQEQQPAQGPAGETGAPFGEPGQPGAPGQTDQPGQPPMGQPGGDQRQPVAGREGGQVQQPGQGQMQPALIVRTKEGQMIPLTDQAQILKIETKLREEGFNVGNVDGRRDPQLTQALTQFQVREGLPPTGQIDETTAEKLDLDFDQLEHPAGAGTR